MKRSINIFLILELIIASSYLFSPTVFANIEVAFLSAFFIIVGSSYSYKKMVKYQVESGNYEQKRDLLDEIDDKFDLYDEDKKESLEPENVDLKEIVKEERAKIKTFSMDGISYGIRGGASLFRLFPYLFLVLGFMALKNNNALELIYYMPSLFVGIVSGSIISKDLLGK